jgi:hypothetical protein
VCAHANAAACLDVIAAVERAISRNFWFAKLFAVIIVVLRITAIVKYIFIL